MEDLLDRVVAIADAFDAAAIPHSFGGALALGYYHTFRATHDIDLNVYVGTGGVVESDGASASRGDARGPGADHVLAVLHALGVSEASAEQRTQIVRSAQTRLRWGSVPIDLFFSNLPFHAGCLARREQRSLAGRTIQILGPEDLIVCKVAFGREKDERDIDGLLDTMGAELDLALCLHHIDEIVGLDAAPARRFLAALRERSLSVATDGWAAR